MKNYSADLKAIMAGKFAYRAELFAIGPCANGAVIYATNGGAPITFAGNVYQPVTFGAWSRGTVTTKIGLESNTCDLTVYTDNYNPVYFPGTNNALRLIDGIKEGLLDQAPVTIYTAYMQTYGVVVGPTGGSLVETKFSGEVGQIGKLGLTQAQITVNDLLYLLNAQTPQQLIQASCRWVLYSEGCTLGQGFFSKGGSVAAVPTNLSITIPHLPTVTPNGTWAQGTLLFESGANKGMPPLYVASWTPGASVDTITFDVPPLLPIAVGDAFTISQGCNKTLVSCNDFQPSTALVNFGGCPNVPVPEAAI